LRAGSRHWAAYLDWLSENKAIFGDKESLTSTADAVASFVKGPLQSSRQQQQKQQQQQPEEGSITEEGGVAAFSENENEIKNEGEVDDDDDDDDDVTEEDVAAWLEDQDEQKDMALRLAIQSRLISIAEGEDEEVVDDEGGDEMAALAMPLVEPLDIRHDIMDDYNFNDDGVVEKDEDSKRGFGRVYDEGDDNDDDDDLFLDFGSRGVETMLRDYFEQSAIDDGDGSNKSGNEKEEDGWSGGREEGQLNKDCSEEAVSVTAVKREISSNVSPTVAGIKAGSRGGEARRKKGSRRRSAVASTQPSFPIAPNSGLQSFFIFGAAASVAALSRSSGNLGNEVFDGAALPDPDTSDSTQIASVDIDEEVPAAAAAAAAGSSIAYSVGSSVINGADKRFVPRSDRVIGVEKDSNGLDWTLAANKGSLDVAAAAVFADVQAAASFKTKAPWWWAEQQKEMRHINSTANDAFYPAAIASMTFRESMARVPRSCTVSLLNRLAISASKRVAREAYLAAKKNAAEYAAARATRHEQQQQKLQDPPNSPG